MQNILRAFLGKKYDIIAVISQNINKDGICELSIAQICELSNASKPTVIEALKELENKNLLKKLANKKYKLKLQTQA